jgi:signal transduction histidine kinase
VARVESGTLRLESASIRPDTLLDEAWQAHRHLAAAASLQLHRDVPPGLPDVRADHLRIAQVFSNLIDNAIKFTPPGGSVTIAAAPGENEIVFSVADTGIGIDAGSLGRVFDRQWQAGTDRRGFGLGLAISRSIAEAHGGRIWAESMPGHGSTFFFTLPSVGAGDRSA